MSSEILDACCGGRMWWWDKEHPLAVYMDRREAPPGSSARRPNWSCQPSLLADFKEMPFDDETFNLVLFDPPHVIQETVNGKSELLLRYGAYAAANEQEEIGLGFSECWRVLAPGGTLVFKWAGSLERVQPHFPCDPVVGSRAPTQGRKSGLGTRWFIFYKPAALAPADQNAVDYHGPDPSVECAYPGCTRRLRQSAHGTQFCSKEHRDAAPADRNTT